MEIFYTLIVEIVDDIYFFKAYWPVHIKLVTINECKVFLVKAWSENNKNHNYRK